MPRDPATIRADLTSVESVINTLCVAVHEWGIKPDRSWKISMDAMLDRSTKLRAELAEAQEAGDDDE